MGFPINPPNTPLVDQDGLVSREWYVFFLNIQKAIGSSTTDPFDDVILEATPLDTPGTLTAGSGLSGGGNMGGNVTASLDTSSSRNVDHDAVSITAGAGLTGGGTIAATRTLALTTTGVSAGTTNPVTSITVDIYGRISAIS